MYKNKSQWYIIRGFQDINYEKISNILTCFLGRDRHILFKHYFFNLDDLDPETKLEVINQDFDGFCSGNLLYNKPENRAKTEELIKEFLYTRLEGDKPKSPSVINERKKDLLEKLLRKELVGIDDELLYKVKEIVSRSISEESEPTISDFINERLVHTNSEDTSFRKISKNSKLKYVWYMPKDTNEIIEALKIEHFFECIITDDMINFPKYLYSFELFEQDDYVLAINDRCNNFTSEIASKIKIFLEDSNYIQDEQTFFGCTC